MRKKVQAGPIYRRGSFDKLRTGFKDAEEYNVSRFPSPVSRLRRAAPSSAHLRVLCVKGFSVVFYGDGTVSTLYAWG
jgi:hypothetical protein